MHLETWQHLAAVACCDESGKLADFLNDQCRAYIHFEYSEDFGGTKPKVSDLLWLVMVSFPIEEHEYFRFLLSLIPSETLMFEGGKAQTFGTPFDSAA
jgi:hypothetical protein